MRELVQDFRYGMKSLLKAPAMTVVAMLCLALGIGANTSIFSVVNSLLLRSLPFPAADQLVTIWQTSEQMGNGNDTVSPANFLDWREQNDVFTDIAVWSAASLNLIGDNEPQRLRGARVSAGFFEVLGVLPEMGRTFHETDDRPGADKVLILSHKIWQQRYMADPAIVGRSLSLSDQLYTVIGVMPPGYDFPNGRDFWIPIAFDQDESVLREFTYLLSLGRLENNVTLTEAQASMDVIAARLREEYPEKNPGLGIRLVPLQTQLVENFRPALLVLMGVVAFVLLIACANVANLLLARASARNREIAIRTALGASRIRIIKQMLTESLLLSLLGGAFGLLAAYWANDFFATLLLRDLPSFFSVQVDRSVLAFTLAASCLTGVVFGLAPALIASRPNLNSTLKDGDLGNQSGSNRLSMRNLLVVGEVALSLVLLIGAGLLARSFQQLLSQDPGFVADDVITTWTILQTPRYEQDEKKIAFVSEVQQRLLATPGIESAAAALTVPMSGSSMVLDYYVEGRPEPEPGQALFSGIEIVTPGYFETMRIPLIRGRRFSVQDHNQSTKVAIISASMAREGWPNEDPIGRRIRLDQPSDELWEIVGIVGDVQHYKLGEAADARLYFTHAQNPQNAAAWIVRSPLGLAAVAKLIRSAIWEVDPDQPMTSIRSLDEMVMQTVNVPWISMIMTGFFSAVALLLALIGVYGVMSYAVSQRTREIGIRMALGAQRPHILRDEISDGLWLTICGLVIGIAASFGLNRLLASLLFEISPFDPATYIVVTTSLMFVSLLACYLPASRATRIDPIASLKYE